MTWDDFPHQLSRFADSLSAQPDMEATRDDLRRDQGRFVASWNANRSLRTGDVPIRIPRPRNQGLHPRFVEPTEAWLSFEFVLEPVADGCPSIADMQVRIEGLLEVDSGLVELEDHWRIDTDRYSATAPREPHPSFHFQRGGHAQDRFSSVPQFVPGNLLGASPEGEWRGLMQGPSPRLAVPPMCPVLMIDFAVSQHDGPLWQRLRGNAEYSRAVAAAQVRLWSPFFDSLAKAPVRRKWFGALLS
jgi:hypothetical protein